MAVQIQLRNGTAAAWTAANPTLAQGEAGVETDTGKLKIGNGSTAWNSLAYFTGGVTSISFGSTGLTPSTASTGVVTVAGTLATANGGTGTVYGVTGGTF